MNRFEALHTLGLEENASDEDVRLAYYGLEKAIKAIDYSEAEHIARRIAGLHDHAKDSRSFLLSSRNKTQARKVQSYAEHTRGKMTITPVQEKTTVLHGYEQVRAMLISYLDAERSKRRSSIWALVVCIIVSFVTLRYLRGMPRVVVFSILGAVAIAGSTILTTSHLQVRKTRHYVALIDEQIERYRRDLGLEPATEDGFDVAEAERRAAAASLTDGSVEIQDDDCCDKAGEEGN